MAEKYRVNEVFISPQGEGVRVGTLNAFIRLTGCNLKCDIEPGPKSPGGFSCDTEFESGKWCTLHDLILWIFQEMDAGKVKWPVDTLGRTGPGPDPWIILTGGEPALQVDEEFCNYFHEHGWKLAIETNGSIQLPRTTTQDEEDEIVDDEDALSRYHLDWITVSPKVAEHAIKQTICHELKYVRSAGQSIPRTKVRALHYLLSPAFLNNSDLIDMRALETCVSLIKENPLWRLSPQLHKGWRVR